MEKLDAWLDQIHEDEFAYSAIYSAYLDASGGSPSESVESSCRRRTDGGFGIRAGGESITLADDAEREALAAHMANRYRGACVSGKNSNTAAGVSTALLTRTRPRDHGIDCAVPSP
ncbi:hypothetical protein [Nocardia sp. NPDC127526]|uniref:hypothetical protein n=1 Tax=Nocardia sp. NPDC127526 TaxID=3345393 RepID=UPI00363AAA32